MFRALAVATVAALALSACGGEPEQAAPSTYTPADLEAAGGAVEDALGVECDDEPFTDGAGFGKIVCSLPEGEVGTGMAVQSFTDTADAQMFRDSFVGEGEGFVMGPGWFVHAPSQEVADEVAAVLQG